MGDSTNKWRVCKRVGGKWKGRRRKNDQMTCVLCNRSTKTTSARLTEFLFSISMCENIDLFSWAWVKLCP